MRAWLSQHRAALALALRRLWSAPLNTLLSLLVIGIALTLPGVGYLLLDNLRDLGSNASGVQQISLFMTADATRKEVGDIENRLRQAATGKWRFVPKEEALKRLQKSEGMAEIVASLPRNPLPDAFVIEPTNTAPEALEILRKEIAGWPKVSHVQLDSAWVKRFDALLRLARLALWMLAGIFAAGLVAATFNTIRLQVVALRRRNRGGAHDRRHRCLHPPPVLLLRRVAGRARRPARGRAGGSAHSLSARRADRRAGAALRRQLQRCAPPGPLEIAALAGVGACSAGSGRTCRSACRCGSLTSPYRRTAGAIFSAPSGSPPSPVARRPQAPRCRPANCSAWRMRSATACATAAFRQPSETRRTGVLIVGGGISGLAAAWRLAKAGVDDFLLLDMEDESAAIRAPGSRRSSPTRGAPTTCRCRRARPCMCANCSPNSASCRATRRPERPVYDERLPVRDAAGARLSPWPVGGRAAAASRHRRRRARTAAALR